MDESDLRWYDYLLASDAKSAEEQWRMAATGRRCLLVCGAGFDPRTLDVPRAVNAMDLDNFDVIAIRPPVGGEHDSAATAAAAHEAGLTEIFGETLDIVDVPAATDPGSTGTMLTRAIQEANHVLDYEMVLIDMSGLPASISFPVIQLFLQQSLSESGVEPAFSGDLVVAVSEDPSTDASIVASGLGAPGALSGFSRLPEERITRIWVPVLGSGVGEELRALRTWLEPDEVCPAVPFPSHDPRRGDDLLLEHRDLLFDEMQFEPRNVLYAAEGNPFDLYRQLVRLSRRYRRALNPLGGATIVVSEHSSKTLSLGTLLAAHEEQDIVVAHVRPLAYAAAGELATPKRPSIRSAWLTGAPYAMSVGAQRMSR